MAFTGGQITTMAVTLLSIAFAFATLVLNIRKQAKDSGQNHVDSAVKLTNIESSIASIVEKMSDIKSKFESSIAEVRSLRDKSGLMESSLDLFEQKMTLEHNRLDNEVRRLEMEIGRLKDVLEKFRGGNMAVRAMKGEQSIDG